MNIIHRLLRFFEVIFVLTQTLGLKKL